MTTAVTPESLRASGGRMVDFYLKTQLPSGQIEGLDDACHYCKMPNALVWGGRIKEADAMFDFLVQRFFRENGDFTNEPHNGHFCPQVKKTLHWEFYDFYAYLNQWWITAGVRLNRFDFVGKAYEYVLAHWFNPKTNAGILQEPLDGKYENCIFTSAHIGYSMMHMGDIAKACLVANTIVMMVGKQPHLDDDKLTYYNRFDDDFNLLTSWPADDKGVKLAAVVDGKKAPQCWWSLGYPAAFLAHLHMRTGEAKYLETAERILEFASRCHSDLQNNIIGHKVMWAASLVGQITGKPLYWNLVRNIAGHIINVGQAEDGRVLNWGWEKDAAGNGTEYGNAQVIDQTCEIAYWFFVVACQMEKAQKAGRCPEPSDEPPQKVRRTA
jgi:hypothetical protein